MVETCKSPSISLCSDCSVIRNVTSGNHEEVRRYLGLFLRNVDTGATQRQKSSGESEKSPLPCQSFD